MIKVKNIYKSFDGNDVFKGLSLNIYDGETVVVIGRSGCGKSVLLKHIIGLMRPDKGEIIVDGIDITQINMKEIFNLRKKFGMVFQGAALFDSLTVKENVALTLREHTRLKESDIEKLVYEKLKLVNMEDTENMKPHELSGGMKKRVGIARALILDPDYILYDEPTTGLDPIMSDRINELILRLKKQLKKTTIVVTHDMKSAFKVGDRILLMYDGKFRFEGTPKDIKKTDNKYIEQFIEGKSEGPIQ